MSDENPVAQKRCPRCNTFYPATPEYFYKSKSHAGGLYPACKVCETARHRADRAAMTEDDKQARREYQRRYRQDNPDKMREYQQRYYDTHPGKSRENDRRRYLNHGEKVRAKNRRYYAAHIEEQRERSRHWQANNPEKAKERHRRWRANNPDKARAKVKRWSIAHPEKRRVLKLLRRAAGTVTAKELKHLWTQQNGCCAYCQNQLERSKMTHVDHIRPVSQGGRSDIDNLCLACQRCNQEKSDRTPEEWTKRWYE